MSERKAASRQIAWVLFNKCSGCQTCWSPQGPLDVSEAARGHRGHVVCTVSTQPGEARATTRRWAEVTTARESGPGASTCRGECGA
jgi:hypothetical protein